MPIQPRLRVFDATMIVVSCMVGVGIFRLPPMVAQHAGGAGLFFLAWILGGLVAIIGAMIFSEIGARKPVAGGYYQVVADEYHPVVGFAVNWINIFNELAAYSFVAIVSAEYVLRAAGQTVNTDSWQIKEVASAIVFILATINYFGIRIGAMVLNFITGIKILTIVLFSLLSILAINHHTVAEPSVVAAAKNNSWLTALGTSFIAVFFSYNGYQNLMNSGGDIQNPKRNVPRAILIGIGIVVFLYLSINFGYYHILGFQGIANSPLVAADFAHALFGTTGQTIISLAIFVSTLGYLGAVLIHLPRNIYAIAEAGIFPRRLSKLNPRTQVQEFTLVIMTIISIVVILFSGTLEHFADFLVANYTLSLIVVASSLWQMRRKVKKIEGFQLPLYPWLLFVFIGVLLFVSYHAILQNGKSGWISIGLMLSGIPFYYLFRSLNKSLS